MWEHGPRHGSLTNGTLPTHPTPQLTTTRVTSRPRRFFVRSAAKTVPRVAITKLRSNVPQRALMPLMSKRDFKCRVQLTAFWAFVLYSCLHQTLAPGFSYERF